jgi:endonuclease YncB( thermonuclease family)
MSSLKVKLDSSPNVTSSITSNQGSTFEGRVEIHGRINLSQFYYMGGQSDADTVKISMQIDAVRYRKNDHSEWQDNLKLFQNANVEGKKVVDTKGRMTIRLQGIDAPELHFRPTSPIGLDAIQREKFKSRNKEFRQLGSGKATFNLVEFLKTISHTDGNEVYVNAFAFSYVDSPNDLFDKYGRAVADLVVTDNENVDINVNQWLVENGWSFPDFYNSMSFNEIKILEEKGKLARQNGKGIWKEYSQKLQPFNFDLVFNKMETIDPMQDFGLLNSPKIFRRQAPYAILKTEEIIQLPNLKSYLQTFTDNCYATNEFLEKGKQAELYALSDSIDEQDNLVFLPGDLVFVEADATLRNENGNAIIEWF